MCVNVGWVFPKLNAARFISELRLAVFKTGFSIFKPLSISFVCRAFSDGDGGDGGGGDSDADLSQDRAEHRDSHFRYVGHSNAHN